MQIAEQVVKNGVSGSDSFCNELAFYITKNHVKKVIETGTHKGQGTTRAVVEALKLQGKFDFYSIEVNPVFYVEAQKNLGFIPGLVLLNGLSVAKALLPIDTTFSVPDHIIVDHYPENRNQQYRKEVMHNVPDNMLDYALSKFNYRPDMVILDSAGHMGLVEFKYLMERIKGSFLLCLDDTCHVKHYDTMQYIYQHPEMFEILWEVESEYINAVSGSKFGSAIIKVLCG